MKVALETMPWGPRFTQLVEVCEQAREIGYQGLEVIQRVNDFGSPRDFSAVIKSLSLPVIGAAGSSVEVLCDYYTGIDDIEYFCMDEWERDSAATAIDLGFNIGIHPHRYKEIEKIADAAQYLQAPAIGLILDTAHQYLSGDDIIGALNDKTIFDQIKAIHLKDWDPKYEQIPLRFPFGFVALGAGQLGKSGLLDSILTLLAKKGYNQWLVVEQDSAPGNPIDAARQSIDWLKQRGYV